MLKQWYGRDSPELRERLDEVDKMQALRDTTVRAESMLLMALDFDMNIDVLTVLVSQKLKELPELQRRFDAAEIQKLMSACNDIMKYDGALVLVYSCEEMSIAICHFWCERGKTLTVPPNNPDGTHWYERYLTVEEMDTINERLLKMYKKMYKKKIAMEKSKTSAATTTATTTATTAMNSSREAATAASAPSSPEEGEVE